MLVLIVAVGCGQKANIGEVSKDKDDEAAIKVVEAWMRRLRILIRIITAGGRVGILDSGRSEQYLAEAESLAESVERQTSQARN